MSDSPEVELELFVRSLSPEGARSSVEQILDRVARLAERGPIVDYDVRVCGRGLPATPASARTAFGSYMLNRVAVFQEWADRNDLSLDAFEERHVQSSLTGQQRRVLIVPLVVLAEYEDQALRFVAPCASDDRRWTVPEHLDELAAGRAPAVEPLPHARAESPETAPDATSDHTTGR